MVLPKCTAQRIAALTSSFALHSTVQVTCLHRLQFKLRQEADDVSYAVLARGDGAHPAGDAAALRDYFNLDTLLSPLAAGWAAADKRFRDVHPYIPGMH
jgi:8-oxoguanine DNA glycosylase, N-terminal domain